ncbi:RNA recognition motif-containing protein [Ptychographa xylographoides]|nr:RNA recognition motif-containing protein [Ptychographa xylographoides]
MEPKRKRQRISRDPGAIVVINEVSNLDLDEDRSDDPDTRTRKKTSQPSRSLFVRSLPPDSTTESLTKLFSESYPLKHATVVVDPATKKSKGYGFVTFTDAEDAQKAKEEFNGSLFEGRKIKVEVAEPRQREVEKDVTNGHKKSQPSASATQARTEREKRRQESTKPPKLIVRNLPWSIKEPEQLALLFRSYGKVKHATIPKAKPGLSAGFGFVVLRGRKNAENALAGVNGKEVDGRTLAVDWAIDKEVWDTLQKDEDAEEKPETEIVSRLVLQDDNGSVKSEEEEDIIDLDDVPPSDAEHIGLEEDTEDDEQEEDYESDGSVKMEESSNKIQDNSSTLFIRNLPFTVTDESLQAQFTPFGAIRYARVVLDFGTGRSKGTGFVCFYNVEDATDCLREAPRLQSTLPQGDRKHSSGPSKKHSLLEDTYADPSGKYTIEGRVLQVSRAVDRNEANRLTVEGSSLRDSRDKDKRRLYLLSEGTVPSNSPLYATLSQSEIKMREDSAKQRQTLIKSNPSLHLSLTRLSIRNIPRSVTSKDLKALAREAVVGFAKDVKDGKRSQLSREELSRGGDEMRIVEKERKAKGKGIVKQAKVVYEGREGGKVAEESGAGRSRGYGFVEYVSHRSALMGLRWLNGYAVQPSLVGSAEPLIKERTKRLIVEFAIENAQVVARRHESEVKARERSRMTEDKRAAGELMQAPKKVLSRNETMSRTRKGAQRSGSSKRVKPGTTKDNSATTLNTRNSDTNADGLASDKLAKRQQIIGRKRMSRKAKNSSAI